MHSVRGVLPSVQAAVAAGVEEIVVAQEAAAEAELVPGARSPPSDTSASSSSATEGA